MEFQRLLAQIRRYGEKEIYFSAKTATSHSYADLIWDIERIQAHLAVQGLPKRARVGLLGDNAYEWLAWNVALVTADYVPVNFSEEHFDRSAESLIRDYGLYLLVSDRHKGKTVLEMQAINVIAPAVLNPNGVSEQDPDVLTLVFSSGTTGHMKGLIISRSGTENVIRQFVEAFEITEADHYFSFLPFSYFQQAALNYCALFCGTSISVVSPDKIVDELGARHPTFIIAPPVFHQTIFKTAKLFEAASGKNVVARILGGNIRFMITAMAPIQSSIIEYFWAGGVHLYETFAVTETGMATWNTPKGWKIGSVGRESEPGTLTIAEDGELWVKRSKPVSLGYFDTPQHIADETFLSGGYVATGDIVEVDDDGFYKIIGRKKHAIITREGKKFHPEEVELLIKQKLSNTTPVIYLENVSQQVSVLLCPQEKTGLDPQQISSTLTEINRCLPPHKRILSAFLTSQIPTWNNGFLTRNLKLNRKGIQQALSGKALPDLQQIL